jgi:hypothetical protein
MGAGTTRWGTTRVPFHLNLSNMGLKGELNLGSVLTVITRLSHTGERLPNFRAIDLFVSNNKHLSGFYSDLFQLSLHTKLRIFVDGTGITALPPQFFNPRYRIDFVVDAGQLRTMEWAARQMFPGRFLLWRAQRMDPDWPNLFSVTRVMLQQPTYVQR